MPSIENAARRRLENGELAIGFGVRTARSAEIAVIARTAGYDWLFIDLEHNAMSVETAHEIAVAALGAGVAPIVGVPRDEPDLALRLLRNGALGTITAHVDTAEQARAIVDAQRFRPQGQRGTSGPMVQFGFRPLPVDELTREVNATSLIVVMLESQQAIDNAAAIAAVAGVDVLLVGSGDLSYELGIPGQHAHPRMRANYEAVVAACRAHGKWAGCGGIASNEVIAGYVDLGVRFVLAGQDVAFLLSAAGERSTFLRGLPLR